MILDTNGQPILDTIHHCDALDLLRALPDGCIDLLLTDFPYNISKNQLIARPKKSKYKRPVNYDYGAWDYSQTHWRTYIPDMVRVLKPNGVIILFHSRQIVGIIGNHLENKYNFQFRHVGTWVKLNPTPQMRGVKWMNGTELFIVATKNKGKGHHFNRYIPMSPDYFVSDISYKHLDPTQKCIELIRWLISYWSFEGDIILDPFVGSGTVAHAAYQLDRHYICGDSDAGYVAIARKRLADANAMLDKVVSETHTQLSLFG